MVAQKVTQQSVFAAANKLSKQGIIPTAKRLLVNKHAKLTHFRS